MRHSRLALLVLFLSASTSFANCPCGCTTGAWDDPYRALEIATFEQRLYQRVDHPSRMRALYANEDYTEARIDSLERQLREYRPYSRYRTGNPFLVTIEQMKLDLKREELHLKDLRQRMTEEIRFHRYRQRLNALRVQHAQYLVAHLQAQQIDPNAEILITSHSE